MRARARRGPGRRRPEQRGAGLHGQVRAHAGAEDRHRRGGRPARRAGCGHRRSPRGRPPSSSPALSARRPRPDRRHQLGAGRPAAARVRGARPDRRADRWRPDPLGRPGRTGGGRPPCGCSTSTGSSSACTAWTPGPASPPPTSSRRRPTAPWSTTSRQVCVLADHTKWGTVGLSTIIPLSSVDLVVSDEGLGSRARTALTEAGAEVTIATQPRTRFDRHRRGTP